MKLPNSLLNGMQNGKHGRGVAPFALLLIVLATIGGVFFGMSFGSKQVLAGQNCSPKTSPVTPVAAPESAPAEKPPVKVHHGCNGRCGMG